MPGNMAAEVSFFEYANIYNIPEIKDYSNMTWRKVNEKVKVYFKDVVKVCK